MLARAGQRGIDQADSPACLADLHILEARALAALNEPEPAAAAIVRAEHIFAQVVPENETRVGPVHRPALHLRRGRSLLP